MLWSRGLIFPCFMTLHDTRSTPLKLLMLQLTRQQISLANTNGSQTKDGCILISIWLPRATPGNIYAFKSRWCKAWGLVPKPMKQDCVMKSTWSVREPETWPVHTNLNQAFNMIVQYDSKVMVNISEAAHSDSAAMKTIAVLTLTFLPATFVSVGRFSPSCVRSSSSWRQYRPSSVWRSSTFRPGAELFRRLG